jgi:hypothetical protein
MLSTKKKFLCLRCGLHVCKTCSGRHRVIRKGEAPALCCDVCRLEMDLTPRDFQENRFRVRMCVVRIEGPLELLAHASEDRADPFERTYFNLTQFSDTNAAAVMRRGNSSLGHQALFEVPVGPLVDAAGALGESSDMVMWSLRVIMLKSGEVRLWLAGRALSRDESNSERVGGQREHRHGEPHVRAADHPEPRHVAGARSAAQAAGQAQASGRGLGRGRVRQGQGVSARDV